MIDAWLLSLIYAAWLAASTMPLGFMLGSSCSPCCGCGVADGKPRSDPKDEGTWVPSGTWRGVGGVTWSFTANPGDESGETWFFYGSAASSKVGGNASLEEQQDWGNICNWYSNKTTSPSTLSSLEGTLSKRSTRLPPDDAVVHIYTQVSTVNSGPQTINHGYLWNTGAVLAGSEITCTASAHDSTGGAVFIPFFASLNSGIINGGANFLSNSRNNATVNGSATFSFTAQNIGTVNGGATFNDNSQNQLAGVVNGGATFNDTSDNTDVGTIVNDGATFNDSSRNRNGAAVNGGATFNGNSINAQVGLFGPIVNGGATFNGNSRNLNFGVVNGGATFNDNSRNENDGTVNDGATFNDAACSTIIVGDFFAVPCTRKFVAHPIDLPTCNGTAPTGCVNAGDTCGCG